MDGPTVFANLAFSCPRCNSNKHDRVEAPDPVTGKRTRLFNPRKQSWREHFEWSLDDPHTLLGRTAIGRATIACLQMNHPEMVAARTNLVFRGLLHESSPP
jgi:hypothetical protein